MAGQAPEDVTATDTWNTLRLLRVWAADQTCVTLDFEPVSFDVAAVLAASMSPGGPSVEMLIESGTIRGDQKKDPGKARVSPTGRCV
ncbi:hypothetical protein ACN2XU_12475 [Primorskyibacter sp. 2E107]|uniref:hypothetical protein n=1 Tax=Primorskyibacter sp. 2E107 TaxID=3403458 RepID=UPI003AF9B35D